MRSSTSTSRIRTRLSTEMPILNSLQEHILILILTTFLTSWERGSEAETPSEYSDFRLVPRRFSEYALSFCGQYPSLNRAAVDQKTDHIDIPTIASQVQRSISADCCGTYISPLGEKKPRCIYTVHIHRHMKRCPAERITDRKSASFRDWSQ